MREELPIRWEEEEGQPPAHTRAKDRYSLSRLVVQRWRGSGNGGGLEQAGKRH